MGFLPLGVRIEPCIFVAAAVDVHHSCYDRGDGASELHNPLWKMMNHLLQLKTSMRFGLSSVVSLLLAFATGVYSAVVP